MVEKAPVLGGTTAMSGGCIWVPNHHHQAAISVTDSKEAALDYIRTISPEGWHNQEEPLWTAFDENAPKMLKFVEEHSPTRFTPNREPDPYAEEKGGLRFGRNVSAAPIRPSSVRSSSRKCSSMVTCNSCVQRFVGECNTPLGITNPLSSCIIT